MTRTEMARRLLRIACVLLGTWDRNLETIDQVPDSLTPNEPRRKHGPRKEAPLPIRMKLQKNRVDVVPHGSNRRVDIPNYLKRKPELIDTIDGQRKEFLGP